MQAAKLLLAVAFGGLGLSIIVLSMHAAATMRPNPLTVWVPNFDNYGFTPGLILLSTAVILFFLPRKREGS
jgi:uncharacterized membrane protein YdjX (TVP38/TMEM64 family)